MSKKVILFLVEGGTDITSLELALEKLFKNLNVILYITKGDLTSNKDIKPMNIKSKLGEKIKEALDRKKLQSKDIIKVIHIMDTDGTYINEKAIFYKDVESFFYSEDGIYYKDTEAVKKRNEKKRENLAVLIKLSKVLRNVPYSIYYLSSNLEHLFHGVLNCTKQEKEDLADKLEEDLYDSPEKLVEILEEFKIDGSYIETWDYLKEGNNSMERCSNLHLIFKEDLK